MDRHRHSSFIAHDHHVLTSIKDRINVPNSSYLSVSNILRQVILQFLLLREKCISLPFYFVLSCVNHFGQRMLADRIYAEA